MAELAATITVYVMVPADDYDERIGEIVDGIEHGCQTAGVQYTNPVITRGIPSDIADTLP